MRKLQRLTFLGLTGFLAACASKPEDIGTQYVSPLQYQHYDCQQISMEMQRISTRVSELAGQLDKKASNDAAQMGVGLVLFWPALFFLEGGDGPQAQEYSRLKGEFDALEKTAIEKKCSIQVQRPQLPKPIPQNEQPGRSGIGGRHNPKP